MRDPPQREGACVLSDREREGLLHFIIRDHAVSERGTDALSVREHAVSGRYIVGP